MAVFDFKLYGTAKPELIRAITDAAVAEAGKSSGCQVISQTEIAAILGLDRSKQLAGCDDASCMAEIAGAMDVDKMLSGQVTVIEHTTLINMSLLDARRAKTLGRAKIELKDPSEAEMLDGSRRVAYEAMTGKQLDTSGTVRIAVSEIGAQVVLDGKELGKSPLTGSSRVLEGRHSITVQKPGYVSWSSTIEVKPGAEVPVEVQLVKMPTAGANSNLKTWGYVSGGAAVAVLGVAGVLGYLANSDYKLYEAEKLRSKAVDLHNSVETKSRYANIGFGIGGVLAVGSGTLLSIAMINDAKDESGK